MDKKLKQELRAKRSQLIKQLRLAHNRLVSAEHPQLISNILNGLIAINEIKEKLR
jgi:hypothetical protein